MKKLSLLLYVSTILLVSCGGTTSSQPSNTEQTSNFIESSSDIETTANPPSSSEAIPSVELSQSLYQNPVIATDFPDPSVVRDEDGYFYAFATGAKMAKSRDLGTWELIGNAISRPTWGSKNAAIWAPEVKQIGEQYVMYYSLSVWDDPNPGIGVATAPHPAGPWTDHGKLFNSLEIGVNNSIDPVAFVDEGRVYLIWGSFRGLYGIELTSDGLGFIDGDVSSAAANKVLVAGYETSRPLEVNTYEAPYIIKKGQYYYLFVSNGQCCGGAYSYNVRVGRSTSVLGVYIDKLNRDLKAGDVGTYVVYGSTQFKATGHNSVVIDDEGTYWMLYHGYPENVTNRRVMLLDQLMWDEDGFPHTLGYTASNNRKPGPKLYLTTLTDN